MANAQKTAINNTDSLPKINSAAIIPQAIIPSPPLATGPNKLDTKVIFVPGTYRSKAETRRKIKIMMLMPNE